MGSIISKVVRLFHPSKACLLLLITATLQAPAGAQAADPTQQWRTIRTPHFVVHYYRSERHDEQRVAWRVAHTAERVHDILTPLLKHEPSSKVHIVVTDDTDGANGSAQIVPRNLVRIFVTGPSSLSSLNDYDDWIFGLLLHEYAHILHIDTIHGVARVINAVLGKTWSPNQIQPRWFIEGLATYYESAKSSGGRIRSNIYDMYLRMAVLQGKLLELDQVSSTTRYFPRGDVPYLYGSRFLDYLARRFGPDKLTSISHDYGGQLIPYAINRTAKRVLGHTFQELYEQFKVHLRRKYEIQRQEVERQGKTPFKEVTDYGEACGTPRFSHDGKELVFIDTDGRSQFKVKLLDVATDQVVDSFVIYGGSGVDFTPDGQHLVYGASAVHRTVYSYHDLFVRHRASGEVRRLTDGLRARDPAISPGGGYVVFTANELGTMSLMQVPYDGGPAKFLLRGGPGEQFFTPRWSPDGTSVVYSRWRQGGWRDIELLNLKTGGVRRLTDDRALDMDPTFSRDGRRVYFSSDRSGIYNLYSVDIQTGSLLQVSNVLGGAFTPAISPAEDRAYFVSFSARGYDLAAMSLSRERLQPAMPYVDDRPQPAPAPAAAEQPFPEGPYNPMDTIWPDAWTFLLGADAYGTTLGFQIAGADVVGRHSYLLNVNFSTVNGHPNYGLVYAYNGLWPSLRLDTSRFEGPRGGLAIDGKSLTYVEENYGAGLSVGLPVLRVPGHGGDVSVGYRFNWFRDADQTEVLVKPGDISPDLPQVGILSGLTLGLSYRSTERYAHSISNELGRAISISLRLNHEVFGSDYQSTTVSWAWTEYLPMPWLHDHVLALRYGGGIGGGDQARRGVFFVGGFPEQDVLRTLFDIGRPGGVYLRGYPPGAVYGEQYQLFNLEYRFPMVEIQKGLSSLPVFLSHIHAAVFVDAGNAFFGQLDPEELKVGVGAELLVELIIGYFIPSTFRIGYARGLMDPGGNEFHFLLGQPF